eukprot:symbB.v1.2.016135.t1/scaffold1221.1/size130907/11
MGSHGPSLLAFVQCKEEISTPPQASALRSHVAAALPAYMVPQQIHLVQVMPLTASGKVDRKALLEGAGPEPRRGGRATTKSLKEIVAAALASISTVHVDLNATLAELGVDSISAAPLADRLCQDVFNGQEEVPLDLLLSDSRLSDLCTYLEERQQLRAAGGNQKMVSPKKTPVVRRGGFTFESCCKEDAEGCWDSSFTFERCCSLTTKKHFVDLHFRPSNALHYDLTHLQRDNKPRLGPVQDDEALLLYALIRAVRPRTIVEFGTSNGFSAINWLHAIADDPDARVYSYDILPYPVAQALEDSDPRFIFHGKSQADFEASDVENRLVEVAFFDAGHLVEYSLRAFERLLPSLTMNAIVAVHDTGLHVLDYGSGAPSEEEGLPFTDAACIRAGARDGQPCPMRRSFAARLAVVAAVFFPRSLQDSMRGVFVRFGQGNRMQCFHTQRRAMRFSHLAKMLETASQFSGSGAMAQKKAELVKLFKSIQDVDDMKLALKLLFGKMQKSKVGTALLVAATDEMGLKKTSKPKEKLLAWLSNGDVADVGEGWERLLQKEKRQVDYGGNWTLEEVWEGLAEIRRVESKGAVKQRAELVGQLAMGCGASVPAGGKYLCRILLGGGLGIGASKKTFATAFAEQSLVPNGERLLELLEVNPEMDAVVDMLLGKTQLAPGARLWSPITPACAQAAKSVEEVMEKIKKKTAMKAMERFNCFPEI